MIIHKITHGWVTQIFEDGKFISQEFFAGDDVMLEDENGEFVQSTEELEDLYHPFDMKQVCTTRRKQTIYQLNNLRLRYNKTKDVYKVVTPQGKVIEEFDFEFSAVAYMWGNKDYLTPIGRKRKYGE